MKRVFSHRQGSVLLLAIWSLFFLGILALAVGSYVSANLRLAAGLSNDMAGTYLARAAVERAVCEVVGDTNAWDALVENWASVALFENVELSSGHFALTHTQVSPDGTVSTNFGLLDEQSKIHLGRANQKVLEALLLSVAGVAPGAAHDLSTSMLDWQDPDNNVLTGGAESGYYETLNYPYRCHNKGLDSLEELLLVKGMSDEILEKIRPHVTVYGSGLVNVNTAGPVVLLVLARAVSGDSATPAALVERILRHRAANGVFKNRADMTEWRTAERMSLRESAAFSRMSTMLDVRSDCFGGLAAGWRGDDPRDGGRVAFVYDRRTGTRVYWYEF